MAKRPTIPKYEPEVLSAMARGRRVHPADVPNTSLESVRHRQVVLRSMHRKASEYAIMIAAVDSLDEMSRSHLAMVICDSSDGDHYILEFDGFLTDEEMQRSVVMFDRCVRKERCGHNGIDAMVDGEVHIAVGPDWSH